MLRIAVCDDDASLCQQLSHLLKRYGDEFDCDVCCTTFESGVELLSRINAGAYYDILFLDIFMPVLSGMAAARELRQSNTASRLVFLTSSPDFALESYSVNADGYMLKPISWNQLCALLNRLRECFAEKPDAELLLRDNHTISRVLLHAIAYVETADHALIYHLRNGQTLQCWQTLSEVEEVLLQSGLFVKPHRSYLVNMDCIDVVDGRTLTLQSGQQIPVSRNISQSLSDTFLRYKLSRGDCHA